MKLTFQDKIAVITGAASGLGLGLAKALSDQGATVIMLDIDRTRLEAAARNEITGKHASYLVDVTDITQLEQCFAEVHKAHGHIDYLFNNAGIGGTLPIAQATYAHWERIITLNLYGVINGFQAIYPIMKAQQFGHIINTSSISGLIPFAGQSLYNTTKFAVTGFSLSLKDELAADNINISVICPGMVKTRIFYKPILGREADEQHVNIPKDAIPVEQAISDILRDIARNKTIIITPRWLKLVYLAYRLFGIVP